MDPVSIPVPRKPEDVEYVMDREQAFLLYATFCGDIERTAHALNIRAVDVLRMVDDEGWVDKLKPIIELKKSNRPGDFERGVNRALNFVQARRLWIFLEKVMARITGMSEAELREYLFVGETRYNKDGSVKDEVKKLSTRALADLATAIEKCQAMTYLALNDTAQDRGRRKEQATDDQTDAGELSVRIAKAMAEAKNSNGTRAKLFDLKLEVAATQIKQAECQPNPHDNDDH